MCIGASMQFQSYLKQTIFKDEFYTSPLFDGLQRSLEDFHERRDGGDQATLIRRVREVHLRTNRRAVHSRVLLHDQTTLQTGMASIDPRSLLVEIFVDARHQLGDLAVRIGVPTRVLSDLRRQGHTAELADGLQLAVHHVNLGLGGGAHGGGELNVVKILRHTNSAGHRGLHKTLNDGGVALRSERTHHQEVHQTASGRQIAGSAGLLHRGDCEGSLRLDGLVLLLERGESFLHLGLEALHTLGLNGHIHHALAGDGVVGSAAVKRDDTVAITLQTLWIKI